MMGTLSSNCMVSRAGTTSQDAQLSFPIWAMSPKFIEAAQ